MTIMRNFRFFALGGSLLFLVIFLAASLTAARGAEIYTLMATRSSPSLGIYNIQYLKTSINKDEHLTNGYYYLSDFQFKKAIAELEICIKEHLQSAEHRDPLLLSEAYSFIGYCHLNMRNPGEAVKSLEHALSLNPKNEAAHFFIANEYFLDGKMDRMKQHLVEAIDINPKFVAALRMLAESYKDEGNGKLAITYYKKLVDILPNSGYYRFQLYRVLSSMGYYKDAEEQIKALMKIEPNFALNFARLGEISLKQKKYENALGAYERLSQDKQYAVQGFLGKAGVYIEMGKLEEASNEVKQANKLAPNSKDVRDVSFQIEMIREEKRRRVLQSSLVVGLILLLISLLCFYIYSTHRRHYILSIISKFNERIEQIYDIKELGLFLPEFFSKIMSLKQGFLLLYNRQNNSLSALSADRMKDKEFGNFQIVTGNEVTNWIIQESKPIMALRDIERSKLFEEAFPSLMERLKQRDMGYIVTLKEKNSCVGFVVLGNEKKDEALQFTQNDLLLPLTTIAAQSLQTLYLFETSIIDELTGLYNKRYFYQTLTLELRRADRYQQPCSLLTFDLDDFKKLNDTYGHAQGDQVLKEIGAIVRNSIREGIDVGIRSGGEEFNIILPATNMDLGCTVGERIRAAVEEHSFEGFDKPVRITVSIGISTYPDHARSDSELIKTSDQALYLAKRTGKNRISKASELDTAKQRKPYRTEFLLENRFDHLNIKDDATGLFNFSYFSLRIKEEIKRANRYKSPCSLLVLRPSPPLDEEHAEEVMQQLSIMVKSNLREGIDTPTRLSDESIGMIVPETPREKAFILAERLKAIIDKKQIMAGSVLISVCIGLSSYPECSSSANELMESASRALKRTRTEDEKVIVASLL
ncbi:MAG: diguanylate cyclase [Candidatus Eremiobacteraeota bacterium]|nr:diguanylate cyclase [Candidatus Eremiobacteraeota bacterium]